MALPTVTFPKIVLPGRAPIIFTHVVLDFSGTLARDGELLPGVADLIDELAQSVTIQVITADTYGTAKAMLADLPVEVRIVSTGAEKAALIAEIGSREVIAIGNGRNDIELLREAVVGIAVIGPEGAAADLLRAADVVVTNIRDALDLLLHPTRLKATLRD